MTSEGEVRASTRGLQWPESMQGQCMHGTVVRKEDWPSGGECLVAGIITKPGKIFLCLAVRDDVQQTEQFTVNAATGGHDGGEESQD